MATFLNRSTPSNIFLGEEKEPILLKQEDPRSYSTERRDTAVLGATSKLPEEIDNLKTTVADKVNQKLAEIVYGYTKEDTFDDKPIEEKVEDLEDQSKKATDLITVDEYLDNSFHAMNNPYFTSAQNLASMKYQLTVEKLTDAIQDRVAETSAGSVLNWFDRYILRQYPIGAFEGLTMKRQSVSEEFARAIAGNMSLQEYESFLDTRLDKYLEQGVLFSQNPLAASDLLQTIEMFGKDDTAMINAIIGAIDLFPFAAAGYTIGTKVVKGTKSISEATRIARTLREISQSPTAATRAGAINGPDAATEVAENIAKRSDDPENLANMGPAYTDPLADNAPVRPFGQAAMNNHAATQVTKEAFEYVRRATGGIYDEALLNTYITTRTASLAASLNRGVIDTKLDYASNRLTVLLGHPKTGKALTRESAERYAEDVPDASVVAISKDAGAYAIKIDEVIKMDDFIQTNKFAELEHVEGVTGKAFAKVFQASPTSGFHLIDNAEATALAYLSENGAVRLNQINKPMLDKINKMSAREIDDVGDIISRLQSRDLASQRTWFTEDEFIRKWKADHKGVTPSKKVLDGYKALVNLSDHTYHVKAMSMLRRMQDDGYRRIVVNIGGEERFLAGKKLESLPASIDEFIDAATGVKFTKAEYDGPVANVFKLDMDINGIKHVVDTRTIKPLEPEDVLGYNAGGPRLNPETTDMVVILNSDNIPVKVALSASSTKSAGLAAQQMDNIYKASRAGTLTDDIVKANNKWYPAMTTVDDFNEFLTSAGIRLDEDGLQFSTKRRDENTFIKAGLEDQAIVPNGTPYGEFAIFSNRRNDVPLMHFGGRSTANDNPIHSIINQANTESRRLAFSNYNDAIQVSLGKKIKEIADPKSSNKDYRHYYRNIDSYLGKAGESTNPVIKRIHERKRITDLRNGAAGWGENWVDNLSQDMSNFIYDSIGVKFNPRNPAHDLTNYGFKTTFFGDPFQFLLQAAHTINIVAMAGLEDGIKGAVMGRFLFKSLKLDGKQLDIMVERMAKEFGYTVDEMKDIRQLFIDSARWDIDPTNLLEGYRAASNSISRARGKRSRVVGNTVNKAWEKTMNAGMFFFNKGEQITRVTAFGAAVRKWKGQNPNKSILTPEGYGWIANKEQAYSNNMTNMSRAKIQQGLLRVPTQFYSYMFRTFENIFVGKNLTSRERIGLAVAVGPFFGMTGIGLSRLTSPAVDAMNSYLPENMQIEAGSDMYRFVKNGSVDALFAWADDTLLGDVAPEVSIASRVSLGDGVVDTFRNYRDASWFEITGGAGGGKAGDTLVDFVQVLGAIKRGDDIALTGQTVELFRNIKFIDNISKAIGVYRHKTYTSKKGTNIDADFTTLDALFSGLGIPLEEVQQVYDSKDVLYSDNRTYKAISKEINPRINKFWDAVNQNEPEKAKEILDSIHLSVSRITGLPEEQLDELRAKVNKGFAETTTWELIKKLKDMGRYTEAEHLREITR